MVVLRVVSIERRYVRRKPYMSTPWLSRLSFVTCIPDKKVQPQAYLFNFLLFFFSRLPVLDAWFASTAGSPESAS